MSKTREKQLREYCDKRKISMSGVIDEALGVFIEDIELQPKVPTIKKQAMEEHKTFSTPIGSPTTLKATPTMDNKGNIPFS